MSDRSWNYCHFCACATTKWSTVFSICCCFYIGVRGATGPFGPSGFPGPSGFIGQPGIAGGPGNPGFQGPPGATGPTGQRGTPGFQGGPGGPGKKCCRCEVSTLFLVSLHVSFEG